MRKILVLVTLSLLVFIASAQKKKSDASIAILNSPAVEGTGLGLSLTYDMLVKGHGGSIQVNSIEGNGAEFIVLLPIKVNL
ncbi:MAG: hypothetical protein JWQ63_2977 [Mucilaginibacter sp.]|jgi:signal transduction histidine kinase|nr:hypothetical protein [Mucilaginibacter sp.]